MIDPIIIWDLDDNPEGNVAHIAEHGITKDEVEDVLGNPANRSTGSQSSDRSIDNVRLDFVGPIHRGCLGAGTRRSTNCRANHRV